MRSHPVRNNRRNPAGGLHGIATLQTVANGTKPCERHHLANRFARLENERARLERELGIWADRQRATATRLAQVNAQVAAVWAALFEGSETQSGPCHERWPRRTWLDAKAPASTGPYDRAGTLDY
jgi:hypothetical protein